MICRILKLERWTTMANEQDKQRRRRRERERVKQKREIREIGFYFIKLNQKYIAPTLFID